jgi:hypothetical protein
MTIMDDQMPISEMPKINGVLISTMSQNISAKESWLQALLQTEEKLGLGLSTATYFE